MLAPLPLIESEIVTLEAAAANGPHPRMRRRAQAVLGYHRGLCLDQLATLYAVGYNAVSRWLLRWQRYGVAGLAEGPRAGRPSKLPEPVQKK